MKMKDVVEKLMQSLPKRDFTYRLFIDNFFGSKELAKELCRLKSCFCNGHKTKLRFK